MRASQRVNNRQTNNEDVLGPKKLGVKLDSFFSDVLRSGKYETDEIRKARKQLEVNAKDFISVYAGAIINSNSQTEASKQEAQTLKNIKSLDPIIATELLLAIDATRSGDELLQKHFLSGIKTMQEEIASALLFEMRFTGNTRALTDKRMFRSDVNNFLETIGGESASEWFNAVAYGDVASLTNKRVIGNGQLARLCIDPKLASELFYSIGTTKETKRLTDTRFLEKISRIKPTEAAELLSATWYAGDVKSFAKVDFIDNVWKGNADVWQHAYELTAMPDRATILLVKPEAESGGGHDRGAKLAGKFFLGSGYNVRYLNGDLEAEEIAETANEVKASSVGFSFDGDAYKTLAKNTMDLMQGVKFFAGGNVSAVVESELASKGMVNFQTEDKGKLLMFLERTPGQLKQRKMIVNGSIMLQQRKYDSTFLEASAKKTTSNVKMIDPSSWEFADKKGDISFLPTYSLSYQDGLENADGFESELVYGALRALENQDAVEQAMFLDKQGVLKPDVTMANSRLLAFGIGRGLAQGNNKHKHFPGYAYKQNEPMHLQTQYEKPDARLMEPGKTTETTVYVSFAKQQRALTKAKMLAILEQIRMGAGNIMELKKQLDSLSYALLELEPVFKSNMRILNYMGFVSGISSKLRGFSTRMKNRRIALLLGRTLEIEKALKIDARKFGLNLKSTKSATHYKTLEISYTSDPAVVRDAYIKLIKRYHPDVSKGINSEEMTKRINEAYAILKDKNLKGEYDKSIANGKATIGKEAMEHIGEELLAEYNKSREHAFEEFRTRTSVPLTYENFYQAIEEVADWKHRYDSVAKKFTKHFVSYEKTIKKLCSKNASLLKSEKDQNIVIKLGDNDAKLEQLQEVSKNLNGSIAVITKKLKKDLSKSEDEMAQKLRRLYK